MVGGPAVSGSFVPSSAGTTSVPRPGAVRPSWPPAAPGTVGSMDDTTRVLVAYATAAGSTEGIAARIAEVLRADGAQVTCRPVGPDLDPAGFDAVVVGSAIHSMAWLPPALDFLRRVPAAAAPVWVFSVGGANPSGRLARSVVGMEAEKVGRGFPAGLDVRDHRVFGGVVVTSGLPLWARALARAVSGRSGDHRDWPAIEAWARQISGVLHARAAAQRDPA